MLLVVSLALRRADAAAVIATAVEAKAVRGLGYRRIAAVLGRPVSTVRGWLRAFVSSAGAVVEAFMALVLRVAPDAAALWPAPQPGTAGRALAVLAAYAAAVAERYGIGTVAWVRAGNASPLHTGWKGPASPSGQPIRKVSRAPASAW